MNQPTVISVNPGEKTLGAINEEARRYETLNARLANQVASTVTATPAFKETINFVTGVNAENVKGVSGKLMVLRCLCSVALGYASYLNFIAGSVPSLFVAITLCVLATSILFGLATRIICAVSFGLLTMCCIHGVMDVNTAILYAAPAVLFIIMGPGIYSIDQLLRRLIFKSIKRKKSVNTEFSYKAYSQL